MEIKDLYVASNQAEQTVVAQITDAQWRLVMPEKITRAPMTLEEVVRYHIWDDAWLPDVLAGTTTEEVGDAHSASPRRSFMASSLRTTNAQSRPFAT